MSARAGARRQPRRTTTIGVLGLAAGIVFLTACGDDSTDPQRGRDALNTVALADAPPAQRAAFTDGKVTRAEYQAAYAAFARCVAAGGGRLEELDQDPSSGLIHYRTGVKLGTPKSPDLSSVEGRCYHETFDIVEFVFSTTDPAALAALAASDERFYAERVRPCLLAHSVDSPATVDSGSAEFNRLNKKYVELTKNGEC